jgi:hypothetical protein
MDPPAAERWYRRSYKILDVKKVQPIAEIMGDLRCVLGNKCAGQNNLKTVHFRETLASGNFLTWSSALRVFFCSSLSTLGRRRQAFMYDGGGDPLQDLLEGALGQQAACQL